MSACTCTYPAGMEFSGTVMETGENVSAVKEVRTTRGCRETQQEKGVNACS